MSFIYIYIHIAGFARSPSTLEGEGLSVGFSAPPPPGGGRSPPLWPMWVCVWGRLGSRPMS